MRFTTLIAAMLIAASGPACAEGWVEYLYADMGFAVQFPEPPAIETDTYVTHDGMIVPAKIYSVQEGKILFKVTVADYATLPKEQANALDEAMKSIADAGAITVDVNSRISGQFGRELTVANKDGSRSIMAVFYVGGKLYQLDAKILPPNPQSGTGDAIRFQQSLRFIGAAAGRGFRPGFGRRGLGLGNPPPGSAPSAGG